MVQVEFFGIARRRAGVESVTLDAASLREVCRQLVVQLPARSEICTDDGRLKAGFLASVNGRTFVSEPETPLRDGDAVVLLSADAGG